MNTPSNPTPKNSCAVGVLMGYFEPLNLGQLREIVWAAGQVKTLHIVVLPRPAPNPRYRVTLADKARHLQVACEFFDFVKIHTADSPEFAPHLSDVAWSYDEASAQISAKQLKERLLRALSSHDEKGIADDFCVFARADVHSDLAFCAVPDGGFDGQAIFANPATHFHAIHPAARQNYTKTVCIVGGESSGKTTLVHKLANHYGATFAPEMGRLYTHSDLGGTEVGLQFADYAIIAARHADAIHHATRHASAPVTFVDTDFVTTQAFCEEYEGKTDGVVAAFADSVRLDLTIMLDNNVAWVADGMRSLGDDDARARFRGRLAEIFMRHGIAPALIDDADYHKRYEQAVAMIDAWLYDDVPPDAADLRQFIQNQSAQNQSAQNQATQVQHAQTKDALTANASATSTEGDAP
ncbi:trifunctional nicotinamide-nucleotide adenylyltransferase/ribosylnicotinamide kinase/transcriptional regulator NadR [Moraxella caviae]|uniref:Trifunctional NAD biosynthesis/regulator protein NadR n=1 Tax=Moraxella caviae TaxID=34060 RepID=A0A1S9ZV93_9GAMM|nr:multifunctional transcriptional regulator/nicotinamide-nucleotide adenylyltransferase/ribosylnicotinamide kinase NadR [Moraxella caviae]OOR87394.1 trifunctional nicotinamide-nucleotide adenylyltransferase/ribosylnicotinamide kinase/transcriptional regulator NadR [Moraxella caviae]STZ10380.1 Trifunctional NAD biosynthesis/regulator protein NadR [Moraxella caviae]VEW10542.1 Trifunctional NAD biosynthesis/regulator protein NadR [Moraxella caviae]